MRQLVRESQGIHGFDCTLTAFSITAPEVQSRWTLLHVKRDDMVTSLSERLGYDVTQKILAEKMASDVGLAFPIDSDAKPDIGRLFTYLPLPMHTGFPCHINCLFALTSSRQHLVNDEDNVTPKNVQRYSALR
jgi:sacsin